VPTHSADIIHDVSRLNVQFMRAWHSSLKLVRCKSPKLTALQAGANGDLDARGERPEQRVACSQVRDYSPLASIKGKNERGF